MEHGTGVEGKPVASLLIPGMDRASTLHEHHLDGFAALETLVQESRYGSLAQAIASLTVFSAPETVRQTGCRPVLPIIRNATRRGEIAEVDGRRVGFDDNKAPTDVFLWCNGLTRRPRDIQFNHVYSDSQNPDLYTCLANLCVTPSFLSKLTDTDSAIKGLLRYRVWDLYGWHPQGTEVPDEPAGYRTSFGPPACRPCRMSDPPSRPSRPKDRTVLFKVAFGAFAATS